MERLTLRRRPQFGDNECLPTGDGLPVWTKIPLDAKLPMMQFPKGYVVLTTTKIGQPKNKSRQEIDFDLRDPNGKYLDNEYQPLHDPHLKYFFDKPNMKRHLVKKGFIAENGKILCSLKQFNRYRQYLRHIFFLEIAQDRKNEIEMGSTVVESQYQPGDFPIRQKPSGIKQNGSAVRRRNCQQKVDYMTRLRYDMLAKTDRREKRLNDIRAQMMEREQRQREDAERRQLKMLKNRQMNMNRNDELTKRWRYKEQTRRDMLAEFERQKRMTAEIKLLEQWKAHKDQQKVMLKKEDEVLSEEEMHRQAKVAHREHEVTKTRERLEKKINETKQALKKEKQRKEDLYAKRLEKKLNGIEHDHRKGKKRPKKSQLKSSWKLKETLQKFDDPETLYGERPGFIQLLDKAIDGAVNQDAVDKATSTIEDQAKCIVNGVITKVKVDFELRKSRSVRFQDGTDEISGEGEREEPFCLKPVSEHVLTPCASLATVAGTSKPMSFVETLLLRLMDDLDGGRLTKEDIMQLASYSMDIIQTGAQYSGKSKDQVQADADVSTLMSEESFMPASTDTSQGDGLTTLTEDDSNDEPFITGSSSSIIATRMVDFTLGKILGEIQSGNIPPADLASLSVNLLEKVSGISAGSTLSFTESDLEAYVGEALRTAAQSAGDPRDDSPVCEAMLDGFMVNTLQNLIIELEQETLTNSQLKEIAASVGDETMTLHPFKSRSGMPEHQRALKNILKQLQSESLDFQTMYQVVFAIVYSYKRMKEPPCFDFESRVTELIQELMLCVEKKIGEGEMDDVNVEIIKEAMTRLNNNKLTYEQIEKLLPCLIGVVAKPEVVRRMSTFDMARSVVEEALEKAKKEVESEHPNAQIQTSVQNMAEAVISAVPERSSSFVDVFSEVLSHLKSFVEQHGGIGDMSANEINSLIERVSVEALSLNEVRELSESMLKALKSPDECIEAYAADVAVKDALKDVLESMSNETLEESIIQDIVDTLRSYCKASQCHRGNTPLLMTSLSSFLNAVLRNLTYQLETGDLTDDDIKELSSIVKKKVMDHTDGMPLARPNASYVLLYIRNLVEEFETGRIPKQEADILGKKLIDCGRMLLTDDIPSSASLLANDVVGDVISTLQTEIEAGNLKCGGLKKLTRAIITSSNSDAAMKAVDKAMKGVYSDAAKGCDPSNMDSVASVNSPSASTIASRIVMQTIDSISADINARGMPPKMINSIATTMMGMLSDDTAIDDLPAQLSKFRPIVESIVKCLVDDHVEETYSKEIFCLILGKYKEFVVDHPDNESSAERTLESDDTELINRLVKETLRNVERSIERGRQGTSLSSIPSASQSEGSSMLAANMIESCIDNIKQSISAERSMPPPPKPDVVDFIIDIVAMLQTELGDGTISELSMAHFYKAISDSEQDLRTLEGDAASNLALVLNDIQAKRAQSVYVNRILETYLVPSEAAGVFGDPVKAISSILVNVSSEILTKFVKATLHTILVEMRTGVTSPIRPASTFLLRSASGVIAESVVREVVKQIKSDMSSSLDSVQGKVSSRDVEHVASRLMESRESQRDLPGNGTNLAASKHSLTSVNSREVEDIVLETLHNIVSNLRFEQSQVAKEFDSDQVLNDFILQTLQNIIQEQQDKRSQMDEAGVAEASSKPAGSSSDKANDKAAVAYVNDVLHGVLENMKKELLEIEGNTKDGSDPDATHYQTTIVESIQRALTDAAANKSPSSETLQTYQLHDVKNILIESVKSTIENVNSDKFTESELEALHGTCKNILQGADTGQEEEETMIDAGTVSTLLGEVLRTLDSVELNDDTIGVISTQLATLGMASILTKNQPEEDASVTSSKIGGLVKTVICKISQQLDKGEVPTVPSKSNIPKGSGQDKPVALGDGDLKESSSNVTESVSNTKIVSNNLNFAVTFSNTSNVADKVSNASNVAEKVSNASNVAEKDSNASNATEKCSNTSNIEEKVSITKSISNTSVVVNASTSEIGNGPQKSGSTESKKDKNFNRKMSPSSSRSVTESKSRLSNDCVVKKKSYSEPLHMDRSHHGGLDMNDAPKRKLKKIQKRYTQVKPLLRAIEPKISINMAKSRAIEPKISINVAKSGAIEPKISINVAKSRNNKSQSSIYALQQPINLQSISLPAKKNKTLQAVRPVKQVSFCNEAQPTSMTSSVDSNSSLTMKGIDKENKFKSPAVLAPIKTANVKNVLPTIEPSPNQEALAQIHMPSPKQEALAQTHMPSPKQEILAPTHILSQPVTPFCLQQKRPVVVTVPSQVQRVQEQELASVCGSHKTKISLREEY